jgi:hypothetical protein
MPLKPLLLLGLCAGSAILTGIGRFAFKTSVPPLMLDGMFILSVVATVTVSVFIVVRSLSRHAQDELEDIDRSHHS